MALTVLGIAILSLCSVAYLDAWVYEATAGFRLGVERASRTSTSKSTSMDETGSAVPSGTAADFAHGEMIGWLYVPRLGLSAVVAHGDDRATLARAVGHIPGTPAPGASGNVGLAGHRDSVFRGLGDIREGDEVILIMRYGQFSYRVAGTRVVEPTRVDVLDTTATPSLTLVTCYPFDFVGAAPERFIVRAHLSPSRVE